MQEFLKVVQNGGYEILNSYEDDGKNLFCSVSINQKEYVVAYLPNKAPKDRWLYGDAAEPYITYERLISADDFKRYLEGR